uniref:Uncharacterized protein n=1 Tax=Accipiter nisus TaxID=211598 RepID=A0A8B9MLG4_9AVES
MLEASSPRRPRRRRRPRRPPNPLFTRWLQEWRDEAAGTRARGTYERVGEPRWVRRGCLGLPGGGRGGSQPPPFTLRAPPRGGASTAGSAPLRPASDPGKCCQ